MIGSKSLAAASLSGTTFAVGAGRGLFDASYLESLSAASCLVIGALASLAAALLAIGWRPGEKSRTGLGLRGFRTAEPAPLELSASMQNALFTAAFATVGLAVFHNQATARLAELPDALARPSPSSICPPIGEKPAAPPPVPAAEIPGCALVRRAYQLGYAATLGSCAPDTAVIAPTVEVSPTRCTLRQVDEPFLHYGWRRLVSQLGSLDDIDPAQAVADDAREIRTKFDHLATLLAHQRHAVAATPHASHHLWLNLPDPRPSSLLADLLGPVDCGARHDRLPLWTSWAGKPAGALVEHVLGQLLFAPGFAVEPSQCRDHELHWDAPPDACARLIADPAGFLAGSGALEPVRHVLDRRRRQIEMARLGAALGRPATASAPPDAPAIVSLACFVVDPAAGNTMSVASSEVAIDGEPIPVRELRVSAVRQDGGGPIDVFEQLAALLAAGPAAPLERIERSAPRPDDLARDDYLLTRLERLADADPFLGERWPLEQAELVEVYPFRRHLGRFIDEFRRRYWAGRSRL